MNTASTSSLRQALRSSASRLTGLSTRSWAPSQRRNLHSLPPLPENLRETNACDPLFSAQTIRLLWNNWHGGLLQKLNDEVRGTQWEHLSIVETVIGTARDPHKIQAFNYASLALNHSFFLSNLKPKSLSPGIQYWEDEAPPKPPRDLAASLDQAFESVPAFKLAFSSMAYGMSGSGYVWLVRDHEGELGIVPTYGAGTVLVQNRIQRGGAKSDWTLPSVNEPEPSSNGFKQQQRGSTGTSTSTSTSQPSPPPSSTSSLSSSSSPSSPSSSSPGSRTFSTSSARKMPLAEGGSYTAALNAGIVREDRSRGEGVQSRGEELYPLLCVSVHERDWLPDYGMWGKEEYLMRFWECVDWARVNRLYQAYKADV